MASIYEERMVNGEAVEADWDSEAHYEKYAGSYAQEVMGYSDEVIDDAFDGMPDYCWSVD